MKKLLTVTALIEGGIGLLMIAIPSLLVALLFSSSFNTPVELTVGRAVGLAVLTLGIACWLARNDGQSPATRGVVTAMAVYNAGIAILFSYAGFGYGLTGIALWPVVLIHVALAIWCIMCLLRKPAMVTGIEAE